MRLDGTSTPAVHRRYPSRCTQTAYDPAGCRGRSRGVRPTCRWLMKTAAPRGT